MWTPLSHLLPSAKPLIRKDSTSYFYSIEEVHQNRKSVNPFLRPPSISILSKKKGDGNFVVYTKGLSHTWEFRTVLLPTVRSRCTQQMNIFCDLMDISRDVSESESKPVYTSSHRPSICILCPRVTGRGLYISISEQSPLQIDNANKNSQVQKYVRYLFLLYPRIEGNRPTTGQRPGRPWHRVPTPFWNPKDEERGKMMPLAAFKTAYKRGFPGVKGSLRSALFDALRTPGTERTR